MIQLRCRRSGKLQSFLSSAIAPDTFLREVPRAVLAGSSLEDVPPPGRQLLVAGIDWGGGGTSRTVLVIGFLRSDFVFQVCRFERFPASEEPDCILRAVAQLCQKFRIRRLAADGGGNGHVYNRLLLDRLGQCGGLYAICYSAADHPPRPDGALTKWTVNRSASIGVVFTRIKQQQMLFPRLEDSGSYLEDFAAEVAEFDDEHRTVRYTHPETQPDDALHATNYALLAALQTHQIAQPYAG